jgi:uncharacterized protein
MTLKERINEDMKAAMRAKETAKLGAIRLLLAAMKQKEVDERVTLDDAQVLAILEKQIKQRKDSINQYETAKRDDLVAAEKFELEILSAYLPAQADAGEIAAVVDAAIAESGAKSPADMGKVMGIAKSKLAGRADMGEVSKQIKAKLSA